MVTYFAVLSMIVSIYIYKTYGLIDVIFCNYIDVIISDWRGTNIYKYKYYSLMIVIFLALGTILLSWVGFRLDLIDLRDGNVMDLCLTPYWIGGFT